MSTQTTDLELLELAAKAAGISPASFDGIDVGWYQPDLGTTWRWNPLKDDGDALRLAVVLRIDTEFFGRTVYAGPRKTAKYAIDTEFDRDMFAAARLAIVRAAAEIGRQMP